MTSAQESGVLFGDEVDTYIFRAFAGQQLTLQTNGGTVELLAPSGIALASATATGGEIEFIEYMLSDTGDYHLRVSRVSGQAAVSYVLTLTITN